jgi:hypothetical protein
MLWLRKRLIDEPDVSRTVGDVKRSTATPKQVQAADEEQQLEWERILL